MFSRQLAFALLSLLYFLELSSQTIPITNKELPPFFEEVWTKEYNQSLSSIEAIVQTKDGYIWFGTNNGLFRYDGVRFTIFNSSNTKALESDVINCLFESNSGVLFIGSDNGLVGYKSGSFEKYDFDVKLKNSGVFSICEDSDGNIFVGGMRNGLFKISKDKQVTRWDNIFGTASVNWCYYNSGELWIADNAHGLSKFKDGKFEFLVSKHSALGSRIRVILKDKKGYLWIGTNENGLIRYKENDIKIFTKSDGLPTDRILCLTEDNKGSLWIGTAGGGLVKMQNNKFITYTTKQGLNLDAIQSLLFDREGTFWVGTSGGGLNKMKNNGVVTYTMRDGLSDNYIWSINQDLSGNIWVGTGNSGVNVITKDNIKYITAKDGLKSEKIRSILCDSRGRVWIGSTDSGLVIINNNKMKYFSVTNGLGSNRIRSIFEDSKKRVWIGTDWGTVFYENDRLNRVFINGKATSLSNRFITEDKNGNLWFATGSSGLFMYNGKKVVQFTVKDGLSTNDILSIHCDDDNTLWIATGRGLNRFRDGKFNKILFGNQFDNQLVLYILEDDFDNLWLSSFTGLLASGKKEMNAFADGKTGFAKSRFFGKEDGMLSTECNGANQHAAAKTKDGRLWFPTMNGLVMVDPEKIFNTGELYPPNVVIDKFVVDDSVRNFNSENISIQPGANKFEIHFAALSFKNPNLNKYKYMLEGVDNNWVDAGNRSVAYYTNLSAGLHTFHLIASNSDGVWNEKGIKFSFAVLPHFYETLWFITFSGLLLALLVYLIYRYRINSLNKTKLHLQKVVTEQTHRLEEELAGRKIKEARLKESEERLNFFIEGSKDGFWDWDLLSDEISFNSKAADIFECSFNELPKTNKERTNWIHPDFRSITDEKMTKYLEDTAGHFEAEYILVTTAKANKWIFDRGKIVERDSSGKPLRMAGSLTDITERKRNEEELLKVKKIESIGLLAGGIAHDFNNLLTAILGNISLIRIKLEKNDNKNLFKLLENSETASFRARDLTQQLLTFSKGGQPITKTTSIAKLIEECAVFTLRGSKVKSYFNIQENLWLIDADQGQINQVIQNMIVNALQAMPNGGKIFISACNAHFSKTKGALNHIAPGDYVKISIKDTGTGIHKENFDKIFDPYFTTKDKGHGLGLSTSYSIIKKHGGHITVESEEGSGTNFNIWLPKSSNPSFPENSKSTGIIYGAGSILIMFNEQSPDDILNEMLAGLGYDVDICNGEEEVIAKYQTNNSSTERYKLVILDINSWNISQGIELIKKLYEINRSIKGIILFDGHADSIFASCKQLGFDNILSKPYRIEDISMLVNKMIGN